MTTEIKTVQRLWWHQPMVATDNLMHHISRIVNSSLKNTNCGCRQPTAPPRRCRASVATVLRSAHHAHTGESLALGVSRSCDGLCLTPAALCCRRNTYLTIMLLSVNIRGKHLNIHNPLLGAVGYRALIALITDPAFPVTYTL